MSRLSHYVEGKLRRRGLRTLTETEALRPRLRLRNAGVPGITDVFTLKLRDYYECAASQAVAAQILYSIAIGGGYTPTGGTLYNKTRRDTNLSVPSQLAAPRRFLAKGLSILCRGDIAPSDFNQFMFNSLVSFYIDEKRYWESTPLELPGGGGATGIFQAFQTSAANASYSAINNGHTDTRAQFMFEEDDMWISALQTFSLVIDPTLFHSGAFTSAAAAGTTFGTGIKLNVNIEGLLAGPVL